MLRKRSRPVTSSSSKNTNTNPTSAAPDHHNTTENNNTNFLSPTSHLPPESKKSIKLLPTSLFFFNSSKLFSNFFFTNSNSIPAETEPNIMNHPPTSRFDTQKPLFAPPSPLGAAPIFNDNKQLKISSANTKHKQTHHHFWEKSSSEKGIGLVALIDETLNNNNSNHINQTNSSSSSSSSNSSKQQQKTKLVVFGSQLKIQIPPCLPQFLPSTPSPTTTTTTTTPSSCCNSPGEFGIKTPRSNLFTNSRQQQKNHVDEEELVRADSISIEEIELSEDYTCVISHGPNPRTTRIFGNCILESCCGENGSGFCSRKKEEEDEEMRFSNWSANMMESEKKVEVAESFLSFCHYCKKRIGEGNDIYMYRGEKAFCSQECRCQGMLFEEVEA